MKNRFFEKMRNDLRFEWNAASKNDWRTIQRFFVSAYLTSYYNQSLAELQYSDDLISHAEGIWDSAYSGGYDKVLREVIEPLQYYLVHDTKALQEECTELKNHFQDPKHNINHIKLRLLTLILIQHFFEKEFHEEKHKILTQAQKIDYVLLRYHDQAIAFFVCTLNYKSARVYLRFVTLAPAFHRLSLGGRVLDEIVNHFPDAIGLELYTRNANHLAQDFYKKYGFEISTAFSFAEPNLSLDKSMHIYFPEDDSTSQPEAFVALSMHTHRYYG